MNYYTAILSLGIEADNPDDAVAHVRALKVPGLAIEALHKGEVDGVNPSLEQCCQCDRFIPEGEAVAYYDTRDESPVCKTCAEHDPDDE